MNLACRQTRQHWPPIPGCNRCKCCAAPVDRSIDHWRYSNRDVTPTASAPIRTRISGDTRARSWLPAAQHRDRRTVLRRRLGSDLHPRVRPHRFYRRTDLRVRVPWPESQGPRQERERPRARRRAARRRWRRWPDRLRYCDGKDGGNVLEGTHFEDQDQVQCEEGGTKCYLGTEFQV